MAEKLVETRVEKSHELNLGDRAQSLCCHSDTRADNGRLGDRCIQYTAIAELFEQTVRGPKHTTIYANILPQQQNAIILFHCPG
jgi:hypothetical protein